MNQAARLGFLLLGTYFAVSAVTHLGHLPGDMFRLDKDLMSLVWPDNAWSVLALSSAAVVALWLIPGLLLIAGSQRLADRLFPLSPTDYSVEGSRLYEGGCKLLSIYLGVTGLAGLVGTIITLVALYDPEFQSLSDSIYLGPAVGAVAKILAAILVYHHASAQSKVRVRAA